MNMATAADYAEAFDSLSAATKYTDSTGTYHVWKTIDLEVSVLEEMQHPTMPGVYAYTVCLYSALAEDDHGTYLAYTYATCGTSPQAAAAEVLSRRTTKGTRERSSYSHNLPSFEFTGRLR